MQNQNKNIDFGPYEWNEEESCKMYDRVNADKLIKKINHCHMHSFGQWCIAHEPLSNVNKQLSNEMKGKWREKKMNDKIQNDLSTWFMNGIGFNRFISGKKLKRSNYKNIIFPMWTHRSNDWLVESRYDLEHDLGKYRHERCVDPYGIANHLNSVWFHWID